MLIHARWMIRLDLPEVADIDYQSFDCAWLPQVFIDRLNERSCGGMVAETGYGRKCKVVGFVLYRFHLSHIELLRLAVHPKYRHKGVGRALLGKLVSKLEHKATCRVLTIDVPEENLTAQLWLRACGVRAEAVHDNLLRFVLKASTNATRTRSDRRR